MSRTLRLLILHAARATGLFALARRLTAKRLRILAYHGGSLGDEHQFRPGLFMTGATFRQRMQWLVDQGYPVLPLEEALRRLTDGTLPAAATVLTIDDGWYGTHRVMAPVLGALKLPATLYVATYYLGTQTQVLNVAAAWAMWSARHRTVDLSALLPEWGPGTVLESADTRQRIVDALERQAEALPDAAARQSLWRRFCGLLGVDAAAIERDRRFAFMTADEAKSLGDVGIDLQLHTHRHRFPGGGIAEAAREIADNRRVLAGLAPGPFVHFCYPSGRYEKGQLDWLPELGIVSAVTTDAGLNDAQTHRGELRRILDAESLPMIEFEAEVSGFKSLFRRH